LLEGILDLREDTHKRYPHLPAQDIIEYIPFPTDMADFVLNKICDGKLLNASMTKKDVADHIEPEIYNLWAENVYTANKGVATWGTLSVFLLAHLRIYGADSCLRNYYSSALQTLGALDKQYASGNRAKDNSMNFLCYHETKNQ
jgi:hypothetical protein